MSGFWGWISPEVTAGGGTGDALRAMGGIEGAPELQAADGRAGLGSASGLTHLQTYKGADVLAAVFGSAYWEDPRLAQLAREQGDAVAATAAFRDQGPGFLAKMRGPFSVALLWPNDGKALLAIDRLGIRSLSYGIRGRTLVFGTSCAQVAAYSGSSLRVDPQAVFDYLFSHVVSAPKSIYQDVEKLLPGQCLLWERGRLEKRFYWQMPYTDQPRNEFGKLKEEFLSLLQHAVTEASNEPKTACFLSGGTDSSTVAGMLRQARNEAVPTYSIGFAAEGFDETEFARIASAHFGTAHREYYVTPDDVLAAIPIVARAYDEPFGNASAIPTYYCAKRAHDDGFVAMLAGDGGDELFGGNFRYSKQMRFEAYRALPAFLRKGFIEPALLRLPAAAPLVRKARRYVEQARIPLPDRLESYNLLYQVPLAEVFEPELLHQIDPEQPINMLREVYGRTPSTSPINRMMHLDLKKTLADNDLRKVNRMCELAGMQVNYPLLDEKLVEFSARLSPDLKVRGSQLRYFFKEALRDFLPPEILTKKKHGFGLPFGLWLTSHPPLREFAVASVQRLRRRGYIKPAYIDSLLELQSGMHASYYGVTVWALVMLEEWLSEHKL